MGPHGPSRLVLGSAQSALVPWFTGLGILGEFCTLPSLNVDLGLGGYLEDLGAILEVLAPMIITI